jgi:LysR family hydrogen peroxide-inducible transcriptional activator
MNIQQLEYVIALDTYRNFVKAAEKCNVTQATLSMMIKKLEEELGARIFDRTKKPLVPTEIGKRVVDQARVILQEEKRMRELIKAETGILSGELKLGIIPTLAPYILPIFMNTFLKKYPQVRLKISELTTDEIVHKLGINQLDAGLLAIPLLKKEITEYPLFQEEFVVYASSEQNLLKKKYILANEIDPNQLWLLEEGHCMRAQVINLCALKELEKEQHQLEFAAGSIETLKKIIELNKGITILPKLALKDMLENQKDNVRYFKSPAPVREIGIVTYRNHVKEPLINALKKEILSNIPKDMMIDKDRRPIKI